MSIWKNIFGSGTPAPTETVDAKKPLRKVAVAKPSVRKAEPKAPPLRKARKPRMPEHSTGKTYAHNIAAATAARMTKRSGGKIRYEAVKLGGKSGLWTIVGNPSKAPKAVIERKKHKVVTPITVAKRKDLQVPNDRLAQALEGAARANAALSAATTHLKQISEYAEMSNDGILGNLVKDALEAMAAVMHVTPAKVVTIRKPKEAAALPIEK